MKPWTVIAAYDDGGQIVAEHVDAVDTDAAMIAFALKRSDDDGDSLRVCGVVPGHLEFTTPSEEGFGTYVCDLRMNA